MAHGALPVRPFPPATAMNRKAPRITLYSTRACGHCRRAKDFLREHHIPFQEQDVEHNRRALIEFQRLGGRGVPLITVGAERLDGFDPRRLSKILRKAGFNLP